MPETTPVYSQTKNQLFANLQTSDRGLSQAEVNKRLVQYGPNKLTAKKKISAWQIFLSQFKNTLTLILIGAAILILFIYFFGDHDPSDLVEAGLIFTIVIIIALLGFAQEYKAEKAVEALKKMLAFKAKVRRDGREAEIEVSGLVPGDIVILEEGTKVPADIRLIEVFSLTSTEASLTGESTPVSKVAQELSGNLQINDQKNMVFSGTAVAAGRAIGVVISTGDQTEIGKIARDVAETDDDQTPIQKRLDEIGKMIGYVIISICALVFVFIVFFAHDFAHLSVLQRVIHSFIAAVALAVAAIPEGLPAVVTISLALGTQRMLRKKALVRKLNSVETLGSTDIICSDKTGTLTKGEMTVKQIFFEGQLIEVSGIGYETTGQFTINGTPFDPKNLALLLQNGVSCNNSQLNEDGTILGDPTEAALLVTAKKAGLNTPPAGGFERVMEIPFSSERKMMTVAVRQSVDNNEYFIFTKGAPEIVLNQCTGIDEKNKQLVLDTIKAMSAKALRTLGFAYKSVNAADFERFRNNPAELEKDLIFLGLQGMIDPPRIEVKPLIEQCLQSGIRVIMITGDHQDTARAVASEIGIKGAALTGSDLEAMGDTQFEQIVETISIYARVNPGSKSRIVDALKKHGHIVAMTGDGVNDAPALKKADIGIAMGITGTDVAKEASDMVLLDDHFSTIVAAIEEGRGIFHNIRKFVNYLLSCNIGEVLVVFVAVMFFQELPLTATMLLWINVVTDGIPAVALGLDPAEKGILRYSPKMFQTQIIPKRLWLEMFIFGILLTVAVLGIYFLNLPLGLETAQGAAFTAIVFFELVNLYIIRSNYKTSYFSNGWLMAAVLTTILIQIAIVYIPVFNKLFGIGSISLFDWGYIAVASVVLWVIFKIIQKILDQFWPSSRTQSNLAVAQS